MDAFFFIEVSFLQEFSLIDNKQAPAAKSDANHSCSVLWNSDDFVLRNTSKLGIHYKHTFSGVKNNLSRNDGNY